MTSLSLVECAGSFHTWKFVATAALHDVCRDIEAGLGEEWAAKGQIGSEGRPHWGHFWRGSHGQPVEQSVIPQGQNGLVMPLAPVAEGAPVSTYNNVGNNAANTSPPTGWV